MSSVRFISWLALFVAVLVPSRAQLPNLPFTLDAPDGHWRLAPSERTLPDGLEFVAAIAPRVGPPRLLVFRIPATPAVPDALAAFAQRLRATVVVEPTANIRSAPSTKIGYRGHLVSLDIPRANGISVCEIFTFALGSDYWGLLQITPVGTAEAPPFAALKKATPAPAGAVALTPFRVHEDPVTSFPVGLRVTRQSEQDRIGRIIVTEVPEGSITDLAGVKVGDEILRIDGRPVTAFGGGLSRRSELGQILIDRRPGSTVEFDIQSPGERTTHNVTLVAGPLSPSLRRW